MATRWWIAGVAAVGVWATVAMGQTSAPATQTTRVAGSQPTSRPAEVAPDLTALVGVKESEVAIVRLRYESDRRALTQFYDVLSSPTRMQRLGRFDSSWLKAIEQIDESGLSSNGAQDRKQLIEDIEKSLKELARQRQVQGEIAPPLVPFAPQLIALEESWRRMEQVDGKKSAEVMDGAVRQIGKLRKQIEAKKGDSEDAGGIHLTKPMVSAAGQTVEGLRGNMRTWFNFYNGVDPLFTWWAKEPYSELDKAMVDYAKALREAGKNSPDASEESATVQPFEASPGETSDVPDLKELLAFPRSDMRGVLDKYPRRGNHKAEFYKSWLDALAAIDFDKLSRNGQVDYLLLKNSVTHDLNRVNLPKEKVNAPKDSSGIRGTPIGRAAMMNDLAGEMIPYTPEELIDIAQKEFAWCDAEMLKASREMGFGDDWKKALEKTKEDHVEPGKQVLLIRDLIRDSVEWVSSRKMLTVPGIEVETLRATMLSPQQQLTSPFFLGGAFIQISAPTDTMPYDARMQSMRGNNIAFSRATVHHELIPGHNSQSFAQARYRTYRNFFGTPFWTEGWALYWEMRLYDAGFARTPEERIGFLFWRMHRCARIVFSLRFHLGEWSPQQCVDYLVERVGHERDNAAAEVRRSFAGNYGPLYQAGYMLGALQIRQMQKEIVGSGKMSDREFHDEFLRQNAMPIAMVRAVLSGEKLTKEGLPEWRFYGEHP